MPCWSTFHLYLGPWAFGLRAGQHSAEKRRDAPRGGARSRASPNKEQRLVMTRRSCGAASRSAGADRVPSASGEGNSQRHVRATASALAKTGHLKWPGTRRRDAAEARTYASRLHARGPCLSTPPSPSGSPRQRQGLHRHRHDLVLVDYLWTSTRLSSTYNHVSAPCEEIMQQLIIHRRTQHSSSRCCYLAQCHCCALGRTRQPRGVYATTPCPPCAFSQRTQPARPRNSTSPHSYNAYHILKF